MKINPLCFEWYSRVYSNNPPHFIKFTGDASYSLLARMKPIPSTFGRCPHWLAKIHRNNP